MQKSGDAEARCMQAEERVIQLEKEIEELVRIFVTWWETFPTTLTLLIIFERVIIVFQNCDKNFELRFCLNLAQNVGASFFT